MHDIIFKTRFYKYLNCLPLIFKENNKHLKKKLKSKFFFFHTAIDFNFIERFRCEKEKICVI